MSQADIRHTLRKLEFPTCAKDALPKIENAVSSRGKQNFAVQLVSEFVFLERSKDIDLRKNQSAYIPLSSLQEFQLILVLVEYFSQPGADVDRYGVFVLLFGTNSTTQRSKILCKLVSTAISGAVPSVLCFAGTWMSQVGCATAPSLDMAQNLVSDFITYSRKTSEQMQQLPLIAPHFTANYIVAVTELYLNEQRGTLIAPPDTLVEVFTDWIHENHKLCLATQTPPVVLSSSAQIPGISPLAGLIRWVVTAPLVTARLIYSKLHLALLQTMLNLATDEASPPILNAQLLLPTIGPLQTYAANLALQNVDVTIDPQIQKSIERLAQIVQIAFHAKCVHGSASQFLFALDTLPPNPLMSAVIATNKTV